MYRHGDLLIVKSEVPAGASVVDTDVLAYGEATGHAHRVSGAVVLGYKGETYLRVADTASVTHEEHATMPLPPGDYKVVRQREYNPYERATRRVVD